MQYISWVYKQTPRDLYIFDMACTYTQLGTKYTYINYDTAGCILMGGEALICQRSDQEYHTCSYNYIHILASEQINDRDLEFCHQFTFTIESTSGLFLWKSRSPPLLSGIPRKNSRWPMSNLRYPGKMQCVWPLHSTRK